MRKMLCAALSLTLCLLLRTCAFVEEPPPPDYLKQMTEAAAAGDIQAGRDIEQAQRSAGEQEVLSFDQLYLLAQYISIQAGEPRLRDEQRLCAGEVLLNRMASPEFPNTMRGVLMQMDGEAAALASPQLTDLVPSRACIGAALRLLQGERLMEPSVVYQRKERQGEIYATFADKLLGFTYFCRSENPELYPSTALPEQMPAPDAVTS